MMHRNKYVGILCLIGLTWFWSGCQKDEMPITTSSQDALNYFKQGRDLTEKLRRTESIQYYQKAIELDSNFAMAYLYLADMYMSQKERLENLTRAWALMDKVTKGEYLLLMSTREGINGDLKKQEEYLQKAINMFPKDIRLYSMLGNFYVGNRQYEKGVDFFKKSIELSPGYTMAYNQLGYCYRYLGKYAEAEEAFKKYIKLIPNDPNPYDSYAELLLRMGEYEVSIENYEKALQFDPNFFNSYIGIATNLNFKKDFDEARKELKVMYRISRNDGERMLYFYSMAVSYAEEGNLDLAMEELQKRYDLAATNHDTLSMADALHLSAYILLEQNKNQQAREKFDLAHRLIDDTSIPIEIKQRVRENKLVDHARLALNENNLVEAKKLADEYFQKMSTHDNPGFIWNAKELQATVAFADQQYGQVIEMLKESNNDDPSALYLLGGAYEQKGDRQKAEEYYKNILSLNMLSNLEYAIFRHKAEKDLLRLEEPES